MIFKDFRCQYDNLHKFDIFCIILMLVGIRCGVDKNVEILTCGVDRDFYFAFWSMSR